MPVSPKDTRRQSIMLAPALKDILSPEDATRSFETVESVLQELAVWSMPLLCPQQDIGDAALANAAAAFHVISGGGVGLWRSRSCGDGRLALLWVDVVEAAGDVDGEVEVEGDPRSTSIDTTPLPTFSKDVAPFWKVVGRSRKRSHTRPPSHWQLEAFFASTVAGEWIFFGSVWVLLMRLSWFIHELQLVSCCSHAAALFVWTLAAMLYLLWTYMGSGPELADKWLDGYVMELVLSMENIFLYHMVLGAFKVPPRMARFALLVVSLFQMVFQMFLFMGIAAFIQDLEILPYLLGAWLIVVGIQTMRDDDEEGFDAANSEAYKTCRLALGDRLLPRYDAEGRIFVYQTLFWGGRGGRQGGRGVVSNLAGSPRSRRRREGSEVTMMGPVILCLLAIMFAMEVDVTLAKIEEIDNHFIAWSSSVLAAFALPELFVVVCELLRRFYLLKPAISFLVMFFGILLLFRDTIELGDAAELSVMLGIVFGSILVSPLLGYPERSGASYDGLDRGGKKADEESIFETREGERDEEVASLKTDATLTPIDERIAEAADSPKLSASDPGGPFPFFCQKAALPALRVVGEAWRPQKRLVDRGLQEDDISSQLVALAKEGKSVCRLKGGDPSIFGRVGEEMEELCAGEVPFEVVPAVTACLAASADARVPLTFRNCATAVRVQTMNPSTIKDERFDWSQFAAPGTTFALYMGLNVVEGVTQKMLCAGVAPGTPMALVDRASLPEMQVVAGTVETLPELVKERSDLPGPALILMGEVVGLRERIAGLRAPVPTLGQPAIASVLAQLPSLSDDELRQLQQEVEETLQQRKRKREELEENPSTPRFDPALEGAVRACPERASASCAGCEQAETPLQAQLKGHLKDFQDKVTAAGAAPPRKDLESEEPRRVESHVGLRQAEELLTALFRSTEAVRMREARRAPGTWLQCLEASMDAAEILAPAWPRPGEERGRVKVSLSPKHGSGAAAGNTARGPPSSPLPEEVEGVEEVILADEVKVGGSVSLLAWHSVGLALGNGVFGALLQRGSAKALMVVALSISLLCTLLLGLEPFGTIGLLGIAVVRGFAGFAAAMPLVAGRGWRFALLAQAAMLFPVTVRIATVPLAQVDLSNATSLSARLDSATSLSAPEGWKLQNVLRELREMLQGMNRWPGVEHVVLHAWHARMLRRSEDPSRLACGFVALGALCGPLSSALEGFYPRLLLLGVWLFSAGALLPICVGLLMTSMPSYLRRLAYVSHR
eukprot:g32328.t1